MPPTAAANYPLVPHQPPDTEALRQAALRASWRRDRVVRRRRITLRWLMWLALRFGLPLGIGIGLVWLALPWQQLLQASDQAQELPIHLKPSNRLNITEPKP